MGVGTIFHNVNAINSLRNLQTTNKNLSSSLEKLSSGLRINRASDDAAGLAVSEKMRAQIFGIDQASTNSSNAISMVQTAEGSLDTVHSTLQRMRTLTLQAANDSYTSEDRVHIQDEINELVDEIDRISNYTEFNTKKLLNGDAVGIANSVSSDVVTSSVVGSAVANADYSVTVLNAGTASNVHGTVAIASNDTMSTLNISNNSELQITVDGRSQLVSINADDSLQDVVNSINNSNTGVVAGIRNLNGNNYLTMTSVHSGSRFNISFGLDPDGVASKLGLNGGDHSASSDTSVAIAGDTQYRFTSGTDTIISITNITSQTLFPTDIGYNVSLGVFKSDSDIFTEKELSNPIAYASKNPDSTAASTLSASPLLKGINIYIDEDIDDAYYDASHNGNSNAHSAATPDKDSVSEIGNRASTIFTRLTTRSNAQTFQIGANESQTLEASFGNTTAEALGLLTKLKTSGFDYNGITKLADGRTTGDYGLNISIETKDSATKSLDTIDKAIDDVSSLRSRLGAYQNSLQKSVDYLGIAYENQVASESTIRDVDMAKEMTKFTRDQILLQSGTAMLSQGNILPQNVLQLLR